MIVLTSRLLNKPLKTIRKVVIFLVGGTVLLVGLIMIVTPGPAFIVIPMGLGILAVEFAWARNLLKNAKVMFEKATKNDRRSKNTPPESPSVKETPPCVMISRDEINQLPLFKYGGTIHLIQTDSQAAVAVDELRRERVLGFDIETRPTFRKGEHYPPALVQLAGSSAVYVFQLLRLRDLKWFNDIFSDPMIIKAGVSLDHDIKKLQERQNFQPAGFVELSKLSDKVGIQNNGLRGLAAFLLGYRVSKRAQRSNWSRPDLTREQIVYAATDAFICREIYLRLTRDRG
jgi:ribonuclease D